MLTPEQIATDWITYARYDPTKAPEDVFDRGWVICEMVFDKPELAWEAIKVVIFSYGDDELLSDRKTEAKEIVGNTAAGPLEDLLANHGSQFIDAVELAARRDRRIRWALGCVWQNSMTEEIWARVQIAAGDFRGM